MENIWKDIGYFTKLKMFGRVEVRIVNTEKTKFHHTETFKTEEVVVLLVNMGRMTSRARKTKISAGVDAAWLVVAVTVYVEGNITLLQFMVTEKQK